MDSLTWLAIPIGLGFILLTLLDIFLNVLHVQRESPISNQLNRRIWRGLLALSRGLPKQPSDELLAWGAPLMIASTIGLWAVFYVLGFALLYLPVIHDVAVFSVRDPGPASRFGDALYFSAVSFFTMGYGDIVALHPLARFLGVVEGAFGLLTTSLSVTYLLSVYPLITRKLAVAAAINQETGGRSDGVVVAARYVAGGRVDALGDRLRWLNDELLYLGQAHDFYPVLYYVRPRNVHESFVRILVLVQGLVATLRYGLDPAAHRDVVTDPSLAVLEEGLLRTLHGLADSSHLGSREQAAEDTPNAHADFGALVEDLAAHGVTPADANDREAAERHARFRTATDRYIRAYADTAGYDPAVVWGTYSRRARDADLVGRSEDGAPSDGPASLRPEDSAPPIDRARMPARGEAATRAAREG